MKILRCSCWCIGWICSLNVQVVKAEYSEMRTAQELENYHLTREQRTGLSVGFSVYKMPVKSGEVGENHRNGVVNKAVSAK